MEFYICDHGQLTDNLYPKDLPNKYAKKKNKIEQDKNERPLEAHV